MLIRTYNYEYARQESRSLSVTCVLTSLNCTIYIKIITLLVIIIILAK